MKQMMVRSAGFRLPGYESAEAFLESDELATPIARGSISVCRVWTGSTCILSWAFRQGAMAFIVKLFGGEDLLSAIENALNG
jgi:hypothetical protein